MATVYLHIGTMKTGSSALQSFLEENKDLLAKKGYAFPVFKDIGIKSNFNFRNAHFLVGEKDTPKENLEIKKKAYAKLEKIVKEFDKIILTDEVIWHRVLQGENDFQRIIEEFKQIGCDVKVIVYLRRQDTMVESMYNQLVKSNQMVTKKFMEHLPNIRKCFPLNYYEHLEKIKSAVGKENLIVRVYEKEQFEGTDHSIYSDFLKVVGLSLTDEFKIQRAAENFGIYGNYIEIKRIINGLPEYKEAQDFMSRPIRAASAYDSEKDLHSNMSLFEPDELKEFMSEFEEINRKVAKEYLGREDGVMFREPVGNLPTWRLDQDTMYESILLVMAASLSAQEKKIQKQNEEIAKLNERLNALETTGGANVCVIRKICRKVKRIIKSILKK